jgi:DNA modification methylase
MYAHRDVKLSSIRKLRRNPRNSRTHSKDQIRQIADSIRRFGWTYPILVDESQLILAGHGRYDAALQLGLREVPVIVAAGLSDAEKRALALADNKIASNAGWDRAVLAAELGELSNLLPECELNIEVTGFESAEIDALVADFIDPEQDPADDLPDIDVQPVTRRGHTWLLARHRLRCGDAKNATDVYNLMGRDRAAMVFADPPFNLRIKSVQGRGKIRHPEFAEASGELSFEEFTTFLVKSLSLASKYSTGGSIHFVCMDWRHIEELFAASKAVHHRLLNLVIWNKTNAGQGSFYRSQHELIFVYKHGDEPHRNNVQLGRHGRNRSNVWSYPGANTFRAGRLNDLAAHPTVKPVALVADAMRDCTCRGEIVFDPFVGSGTTILAAERVGRRGYGLEIDPIYVDVAIRRWENFTRRDAVLTTTGQTFAEVANARVSRGLK